MGEKAFEKLVLVSLDRRKFILRNTTSSIENFKKINKRSGLDEKKYDEKKNGEKFLPHKKQHDPLKYHLKGTSS